MTATVAPSRSWILPTVVYSLAILLTAVAVGRSTGRWSPLPSLDRYTGALEQLPLKAGNWVGQPVPLEDAESLERAGIFGHLHRQYRDAQTGGTVTMLLLCGRPGPISVHTPDVCYRGAGFIPFGEPTQQPVAVDKMGTVPFWWLRLQPPNAAARVGNEMEIRWAWVAPTTGVAAPNLPRVQFAREPALYKLYVISSRYVVDGTTRSPNVADFLNQFVPQIQATLVTPPSTE
jgi:Protein of unknown function (DUF3485)